MALQDQEFDMLSGEPDADESPAEDIAELDTGGNEEATGAAENDDADSGDAGGEEGAGAEQSSDTGAPGGGEAADRQAGGQTVPLAILLDERKTFQGRLDEMSRELAKFSALQERIDHIQAEKNKPEPEPEPEYLDDPKGYVDHKVAKAEELNKSTADNVAQLREHDEARAQLSAINNRLGQFDANFVKDNEDYYDALDHVRQINIENIKAMGATEEQAQNQAAQAIFMAQTQALRTGIDPAEYMYNMAKRFGYSGPAPDDPGKKEPGTDADDSIIAGQNAMGMGGGVAPDDESGDEEDLTDEEFAEAFRETWGVDAH